MIDIQISYLLIIRFSEVAGGFVGSLADGGFDCCLCLGAIGSGAAGVSGVLAAHGPWTFGRSFGAGLDGIELVVI